MGGSSFCKRPLGCVDTGPALGSSRPPLRLSGREPIERRRVERETRPEKAKKCTFSDPGIVPLYPFKKASGNSSGFPRQAFEFLNNCCP